MAGLAFVLQLALHHDLRGNARMVGARQPQRVVAAHAVVAREGIHDGLVERMPHVQRARHIRWWQLDGERGLARIERRLVNAAGFPQRAPVGFDGGGLKRLGEFGLVGFRHGALLGESVGQPVDVRPPAEPLILGGSAGWFRLKLFQPHWATRVGWSWSSFCMRI